MSEDESVPKEGRYRLRLSLRPRLYNTLESLSETLDLEPNAVAMFALSLGLRVMSQLANPNTAAMSQYVNQQADVQIQEAVEDANIEHRVKKGS